MLTRVLNANKMIRNKNILEVVNHNVGGPGSLFDPNIFGYGNDTIRKYGFIRLNGPLIHPIYFDISSRTWRDLPAIVNGTKYFTIDKTGDLIPSDEENGYTGVKWLYDNFEKINLKKLKVDDSDASVKESTKKMKQAVDKVTKDNFFIDRIMVLPLHFRDLDTEADSIKMDELNQMYIDLIKAASFRQKMSFESHWNNMKMQGILQNIYDYFDNSTNSKKGVLRNAVMGKSVDNAIRLIIVAPEVRNKDILGRTKTRLDHILIPLHHFLNASPVHAVTATKRVLQSFFDYGLMSDMTQLDFDNYFSDKFIEDAIVNYDHSQYERLKPVITKTGKTIDLYFDYHNDETNTNKKEVRPLTWVDLFFLAVNIYKDSLRAVVCRYPVTNKDSNLYVKPSPSVFLTDIGDVKIYLSKEDSEPLYTFEDCYPDISKYQGDNFKMNRIFDETLRLSNMYLQGLGGDVHPFENPVLN